MQQQTFLLQIKILYLNTFLKCFLYHKAHKGFSHKGHKAGLIDLRRKNTRLYGAALCSRAYDVMVIIAIRTALCPS